MARWEGTPFGKDSPDSPLITTEMLALFARANTLGDYDSPRNVSKRRRCMALFDRVDRMLEDANEDDDNDIIL